MARLRTIRAVKLFLIVWFGQTVSLAGSGLTGFALGIWVYQRTASATLYALIFLFTSLPGLLASPIAGALVDRWERRQVMLLCDSMAGVTTLVLALLLLANQLQVWQIYLGMAVISVCSSFQWLAYSAATTLLVPHHQLGRANGMVQLAEGLAQIVAPALAGLLLVTIHIQGVVLIDFATYLFSLLTLWSVRFPTIESSTPAQNKGVLWQEALYGWGYIRVRPGLLGLLLFLATSNFAIAMVTVLVTPMVLAFASARTLGVVLSIGGSGMLVGSVVMSVWGGPRQGVYGVLGAGLLMGICIFITGLQPSIPLITAAAFCGFCCSPVIGACSQAIWQRQVPPALQGRVFAVRRMIAFSAMPIAYLVAGPLADRVFEPLLAANGPLTSNVGQLIEAGPGRGIALLFLVMGTLSALASVGGYLYPPLRFVEAVGTDTST